MELGGFLRLTNLIRMAEAAPECVTGAATLAVFIARAIKAQVPGIVVKNPLTLHNRQHLPYNKKAGTLSGFFDTR